MERKFLKTWSTQSLSDLDQFKRIKSPFKYSTKKWSEITDLSSISFQASFGLKNKSIEKAILGQLKKNSLSLPAYSSDLIESVSEQLINFIGLKGKIFYTTSGAEAVSNAIKILRQSTKKNIIFSTKRSYHGSINESLEVTGDWRRKDNQIPTHQHRWLPSPEQDPLFDKSFELLKKQESNLCGVIIEPTSGKNGVFTPPATWWDGLKKARKKLNFKIIIDEVICGFFRTGKTFGFCHHNIKPDAICMAKGITGGFIPMGATFISKDSCEYFNKNILSAGLTNYAHPLGLAACSAVIKICQSKGFIKTLNKNIELLQNFKIALDKIQIVQNSRIKGMLFAFELSHTLDNDLFLSKGYAVIQNKKMYILAPSLIIKPSLFKKSLLDMNNIIKEVNDIPNVLKKTI